MKEQFDREKSLELLRSIIAQGDRSKLEEFIEGFQPIDFAETVSGLDSEDITVLTAMMDDDELASLMEESEDGERIRICRTLDNKRLLAAMDYMQKDDIVDMLGDFPIGRRKDVVNQMKSSDRQIITRLLEYPEDSAGGIMTTDYIALKKSLTVAECIQKLKEIGPKTEVLDVMFVIDSEHWGLVGTINLRNLLSANEHTQLQEIMDEHVISVTPETDQEEAALVVSRYDLKALPVVSNTNQILGIITVDDVIDVIVEEYEEDMLQMAGVSAEESIDSSLKESIRFRLPWLLVNLATAFLASFTISLFEGTISKVVALSAVMTIISGMGGNAGTQTMSILVRTLAQQSVKRKNIVKPMSKEILLGFVNGVSCGVVTAGVVYVMYQNIHLSLIVVLAMVGNLLVSAVFGFLVPVVLKQCHADPAIASPIFVTTATDVLGFFIFLGLASLFLPLLM